MSIFKVLACISVLTAGLILPSSAMALLPKLPWEYVFTANEIAALTSQAEAGDWAAQRTLAEAYYNGSGIDIDYALAQEWYQKSGDKDKVSELSAFIAEHARLYELAKSGNAEAQYNFATHRPHMATHLQGDAPTGHWLGLAARQDHEEAQAMLGDLYLDTYYRRRIAAEPVSNRDEYSQYLNRPKDFDDSNLLTDLPNAIAWLGKAASKGHAFAQRRLSEAYAVTGPTRDMGRSISWLEKAAANGSPYDLSRLCEFYFTGDLYGMPMDTGPERELISYDGPSDYPKAFACYNRILSIEPNTYQPNYPLGYLYRHGLGIKRDDRKAEAYLVKIISDPEAKYELAMLYSDSLSVPRQSSKAYILLSEAMHRFEEGPRGCFGGYPLSTDEVRRGNRYDALIPEGRKRLVQIENKLSAKNLKAVKAILWAKYIGTPPTQGERAPVPPPLPPCV